MQHALRKAVLSDQAEIEKLIAKSIRTLGASDYTPAQIEAALRGAFGVDTQLIRDGTYFVAEMQDRIVGCGGWSYRRTLFGSDAHAQRDAGQLNPEVDAAKIRAFFIDPDFARHGIGASILSHCESEAVAHGFRRFEMMATLPGVRLYAARGYQPSAMVMHPVGPDLTIQFVPMWKDCSISGSALIRPAVEAEGLCAGGPAP